jgi:hypothetical protein
VLKTGKHSKAWFGQTLNKEENNMCILGMLTNKLPLPINTEDALNIV